MIRIKPHTPKPRAPDAASWGDGQKFFPLTITLEKAMIRRLDDKAEEMKMNRSAAIRAMLGEALAK
jgi:hypothetical protein